MAKVFSVASWNVEHFGHDPARVQLVARFIAGQNGGPATIPDVFALYEVEGKDAYHEFMSRFPDHRFHLTEGRQTQEIFIGVHKKLQSFSTQRMEFKTGREYQRPGLLLSIRKNDVNYSLLFLHIRSGDGTEDFGMRDRALAHAFNLKKTLDDMSGVTGPANLIFLGDLNTMGIDDPVPYSRVMDFSPEDEVKRIARWAGRRHMTLLSKERTKINDTLKEVTWWNGSSGYEISNIDHVVSSDHMDIRSQGNGPQAVSVLGWPKLPPSQWNAWFTQYSDHAMLYFEIW